MPNYVPGRGSISAQIAFIGEAPGQVEDETGIPFTGPSGNLLWSIAEEAGIKRDDVYVTNISKYRPPNNDFTRLSEVGVDIHEAVSDLKEEINQLDPNIVVIFGKNALAALTGRNKISDWRGSLLWWNGRKMIPTLHPAYILHSSPDRAESEEGETQSGEVFKYWMKYLMVFDLRRALKHSEDKEYRQPKRIIQVARTYYDLYSFVEQESSTGEMAADIEAVKGTCMPGCISFAFSPSRAISVPLYHQLYDKPTGMRESDVSDTWSLIARLFEDPKIKKVGQNWKYDEDKINRLGFYLDKLWIDTSFLAHTVYPEFWKKLAFLTSICTEEPFYKDDGKMFDPAKDDMQQWFIYNAKDSAVTMEVKNVLYQEAEEIGMLDFFFKVMMPCHRLYLDMERVGFHVDEHAREELTRKYSKWSAENFYKLTKLIGHELNVNSPQQVSRVVYGELNLPLRHGRGVKRTAQGSTGEDVLSQLLANTVRKEEHREILTLILTERRVRKTMGPQYLFARPDYDGRVKSTWNVCGTENGRTSTKMLKPPVRPEKIGISFQTFTKHGDVGGDLRLYLISRPGTRIVNIDSAQAEARVCFVLAEDWETLKIVDEIDIHALTASWCFGGGWFDHSKKKHGYETPERFIGKTTRHAGHLDIRKGEFARMVTADARKAGINVGLFSEYKAGRILDTFHAQCPRIRQVFHEGVIKALEHDRILITPQGRRREFFERWGRELWKEAYAFIPQATVSDNTKLAMIDGKERFPDIEYIGESHDAITFQAGNDWEEKAVYLTGLMERPISFAGCTLARDYALVIPAEVEIGVNYKEMKKVNLMGVGA